ncbi:MAG: aromatic ring-hydroxylating dioxygenase subunit alpha [Caulobacterales bacterium]
MAADTGNMKSPGATAVSPPFSELLAREKRPLEFALTQDGDYTPKTKTVPFRYYTDPEIAKLEMEHIWKKSWQMVGREEDIPEVGDRRPYDVGDLSYLIIRSAPGEFRALQNACLHRGTRLCHGPTSAPTIKCPYHAWEWNPDGSLKNIPSRWDFPDVTDAEYRLPEAKTGSWGGYLFINPDPDAEPLENFLGVMKEHFTDREAKARWTWSVFRKKLRANWKQAQEAFLEAYHVIETHAQIAHYNADTTAQYDIWDDGKAHISRSITASAVPSGHLGDDASLKLAAEDSMKMFALATPGIELPEITAGESGRAEVAEFRRKTYGPMFGRDFANNSDAYMLDAIQYFMFPNFFPWWGEGLPISYQFLPYGSDPNECSVEIRFLLPVADGAPTPHSAETIEIDFDEPLSKAGMGYITTVFEQDFSNVPLVQIGLRSARDPNAFVTLARYQENRIAAFYDLFEKKLGLA